MTWQRLAAVLQNVLFDANSLSIGVLAFRLEHDVSDYNRTRDRTLFRAHQRHPDLWMPVDHRLDFLGMNFQPTDVDDTVRTTDKVITIATPLDDIAGVDETVFVD